MRKILFMILLLTIFPIVGNAVSYCSNDKLSETASYLI